MRPPSAAGAVVRVASGNFLEMYDFMVFGYYAAAIGHAFFPARSALASLLLAFGTFGAGFLMRPLGAVVLGALTERIGLRRGLLVTLGLMGVGTLTLAATPSYATIGLAAPVIVLLGRLLQGFSAGVEIGSTSVYLASIAPERHRGFFVSFQSASQQVAVITAACLALGLGAILGEARMAAWGWRIPLGLGCAILPLLFVLRRSLQDAGPIARPLPPRLRDAIGALFAHRATVLTGVGLVVMTTVSFYVITAYTPSFGRAVLHLSSLSALTVTLCVGVSNLVLLPAAGALSDRIGRRPILLGATAAAILTAYPAMHFLAAAPSFGRLLGVELLLSAIYASYNGAMVVALTELVPASLRTSGFSLAYSLATCVGGFTPAICTALIHATGDRALPGAWLTLAALCGMVATVASARSGRAGSAA